MNNVHYLTKIAELDATIDKTTFPTASSDQSGVGVTFRLIRKPNVSGGWQTVLVCDSHLICPRAHHHRYKLHAQT